MNNSKENLGQALRQAAFENDFLKVKELTLEKADINYKGDDGSTALHESIRNENVEVTKYLLENNADVTIENKYGQTPYHEACYKNNKVILELIKSYYNKEKEYYIELLKENNVPDELINYLGMERKEVIVNGSEWTKRIYIAALDEVRIFTYNNVKYIDLIAKIDNYSNIGIITWIPKENSFGYFNYETEDSGLFKYMTWNEFLEIPQVYIDKALNS